MRSDQSASHSVSRAVSSRTRRPALFDAEADEQRSDRELAADLTEQFWGASPGWTPRRSSGEVGATTEVPVVDRRQSQLAVRRRASRRDATGRLDRTRSHGIPRPTVDQTVDNRRDVAQRIPVSRSEATLAELAAGQDRPRRATGPAPAPDHRAEFEHELEMRPRDLAAPLAQRFGLGGVDPLLARLGAIAFVGVMLVPVAMAVRGGGDSIATASPAPTVPAAPVTIAVVAPPSAAPGVASGAPAPAPAGELAALAISQPVPAAAASETSADGDSADGDAAGDSDQAAAPVASDAPSGVATADEPAERLEPVCEQTYVAGPGDSWYRIADAAGISPATLMAVNLADVETPIFPGDEICLPADATMPTPPTTTPETTAPPTTAPPSTTAPPTTAPPTTAPPTTAPATSTPASTAEVQRLIREIWPDELEEKALQVAYRESRYVATAWNGHCCYGVFQIHWTAHKSWLDDYGITSTNDLLDARKNITAAYALYQSAGGWGPWGG